jgi:hypothetical protein
MTPNPERLRKELLAAEYCEALETDDFETEARLWKLAETEPELIELFQQVHADLLEERLDAEAAQVTSALTNVVAQHLKAEIINDATQPVTVAAVADELFRHAPDRLSPVAHQLIERMRQDKDELPDDLGLSKLTTWLEVKFGKAEAELWKAFRAAAVKLEGRRASEIDYQMAARKAHKPEKPQ